jgi:hypothetical protein
MERFALDLKPRNAESRPCPEAKINYSAADEPRRRAVFQHPLYYAPNDILLPHFNDLFHLTNFLAQLD